MIQLYRAPYALLLVLELVTILCFAGQASVAAANWFYDHRGIRRFLYDMAELVQMAYIGITAFVIARLINTVSYGMFISTDQPKLRYALFGAMLLLLVSCRTEDDTEMMWEKAMLAVLTLPILTRVWGRLLAQALLITMVIWMVLELREIMNLVDRVSTEAGAFSVRVALSRVSIGLMLCGSRGRTFFANKKMDIVTNDLFGEKCHSGAEFERLLREKYGVDLPEEGEIIVRGQIADWAIARNRVYVRGRKIVQISANEVITPDLADEPEERS
ncbi:MAG: hypothetical protein PUB39_01015 [Eubacteriales bacterium]|nr:hypothetical protein [Eubacteriales bacterium]